MQSQIVQSLIWIVDIFLTCVFSRCATRHMDFNIVSPVIICIHILFGYSREICYFHTFAEAADRFRFARDKIPPKTTIYEKKEGWTVDQRKMFICMFLKFFPTHFLFHPYLFQSALVICLSHFRRYFLCIQFFFRWLQFLFVTILLIYLPHSTSFFQLSLNMIIAAVFSYSMFNLFYVVCVAFAFQIV